MRWQVRGLQNALLIELVTDDTAWIARLSSMVQYTYVRYNTSGYGIKQSTMYLLILSNTLEMGFKAYTAWCVNMCIEVFVDINLYIYGGLGWRERLLYITEVFFYNVEWAWKVGTDKWHKNMCPGVQTRYRTVLNLFWLQSMHRLLYALYIYPVHCEMNNTTHYIMHWLLSCTLFIYASHLMRWWR